MRQTIFVVLVCLLLNLLPATAQDAPPPIIALKDGYIYAFNPADDSVEPLVLRPENYDEIVEFNSKPVVLSSTDWLSPDGQYLAYRVISPSNPAETISATSTFTQTLFILDLHNPDQPILIDLGTNETLIESVVWSFDNTMLYVLANNALNIVERASWAIQTTIDVGSPHPSQAHVITRRIYAVETGVVMIDATDGLEPIGIVLTVFDAQGNQLNTFQADWEDYPDTTFYSPFEPLEIDGSVQYGFVNIYNVLAYLGNFAPDGAFTIDRYSQGDATVGVVSRSASETSLSVTLFGYQTTFDLTIRDADDSWFVTIPQIQPYAYGGYSGDHFGTRFALSPDGQSLAYLSEEGLVIWHDGESLTMDFTADVIIWSAPMYLTVALGQ